MGSAAVDALEEAWDSTRDMLLPFDRGTWLRLAFLVVFTGAGLNLPSFSGGGYSGGSNEYYSQTGFEDSGDLRRALGAAPNPDVATSLSTASPGALAVAVVALVVLVFAAAFFFLSSVFELVYYRSLLDEDVKIRENFSRHFSSGWRYFLFRTGVAVVALTFIGLLVGAFLLTPLLGVLGVVLGIPILVVVAVFLGLTNSFAVPYMVENGGGVIGAWRDIYGPLKAQLREVGLYILIRFVIRMVGGIVSAVGVLVVLLGAAMVFGIPLALLYQSSIVVAALLALAGVIVVLAGALAIQVPVQTFMYFHALKVYDKLL